MPITYAKVETARCKVGPMKYALKVGIWISDDCLLKNAVPNIVNFCCVFVCVCVCVGVCVCVWVCVCVCVCVTYISSSSYATTPILNSSVFLLPSVPSYTPTPISPLLYADNRSSPFPLPYNRPFLSFPFCLPRFSHARAQEVTSPLHPSDLVAAKCAPLCREGRGGAGC